MTWDEAASLLRGADWHGAKAGLERIRELLRLLGDPHKALRFVHIAGTNGKGSAAAIISSVLTASGLKTGLYISPHLILLNERFQIDGEEIADEDIARLAARVRAAAEKMCDRPADFELMTALAFLWFSESRCDIAVLEVGLGGRFDATNIIDAPLVSVVMKIGLDHTAQLGGTIERIAREKAGIIKAGSDAVLYSQSAEVESVIAGICAERGASLTVTRPDLIIPKKGLGQCFSYRDRQGLYLNLDGPHQLKNAAAALDALDILKNKHGLDMISEEAVFSALSSVSWPGRLETISSSPRLIVDGAHNPDGVKALAESILSGFSDKKLIFIMGVMRDKDHALMLQELSETLGDKRRDISLFIATSPDDERALGADELNGEIKKMLSGCPTLKLGSSESALRTALSEAEKSADETVILAFGSLYLVGEIKALMRY